jgi:hypothetical protein
MGPHDEEIEEALSGLQESATTPSGHTILRPMVLSLIQSSYVRTQTLPDFARDVYDIMSTALSVPVAFAEGFLRSFLSIESVLEDESGRVVIRPKTGASEKDLIREVDELTAAIDPGAIYNPVVREQMDRVAEATNLVMQQDLLALSELDSAGLTSALGELVDEQMMESVEPSANSGDAHDDVAALRERLARVRESIRDYQAGFRTLPVQEYTDSESPDGS